MARKKKKEGGNAPQDEMSNMDMNETSSMSSQFTVWADALLRCVDTMESSLKLLIESNNMMKQILAIVEAQPKSMSPTRGTAVNTAPQLDVMHQTSTSQTGNSLEKEQVVLRTKKRDNVNSRDSTTPYSQEKSSPILSVESIIQIIPTFDGNKEDYGVFMQMFNWLIHENPEIPTTWKQALLLRLLTGEARSMFRSVSISKEEYERLRWNLERQYNPEFSFSEY